CERHSSAWISAATEPWGGSRALNSLPCLTRLLAIDTTIFPCSRSACSCTVGMAESALTARMTIGASHAQALSHGCRLPTRSPHFALRSATLCLALSTARDPYSTSSPESASRDASTLPGGPGAPL